MPLPKSLTTITPFSKALALTLFIVLPILGFFLGIFYQQSREQVNDLPDLTTCKHWETVCDPSFTDENHGGCAPKKVCSDLSPSPSITQSIKGGPAGLTNAIEVAKKDLASNLTLPLSSLSVVSAEEVAWNNGSLGCPKPGFMYTQHIVPGYKIVLSDGTKTYSYHGTKTGEPFLCENPRSN